MTSTATNTAIYMGSVTGDNHLDIAMDTDEGEQQMLSAFIQPKNEKGEGYYSEAQTIVTGAPYSIPFKETFANGTTDDAKLWFYNMNGSSSWYLNGDVDSPGGGATGVVVFDGCGDESYFASGKINPAGRFQPEVVLQYPRRIHGGRFNDRTGAEERRRPWRT